MTKIALVGEAWGEHEERSRMPFVGPAGFELTRLLDDAGIRRADCFTTNVFNLRPRPTNDVKNLCTSKKECGHGLSSLSQGKYLRSEYLPELARLRAELLSVKPNIAVALGGTAAWALLGQSGITKIRGTAALSYAGAPAGIDGLKVLPTFHPSYIMQYGYDDRATCILDLAKALRESEFPELRRPKREIWIEPTLSDIALFFDLHLRDADIISYDIETFGNQITCIGFSPDEKTALVIPFVDERKPSKSYWDSPLDELFAWDFVRKVLALPQPKVGQNALYDMHHLWRFYGIPVVNASEDTMLFAHAINPELKKGLGFLASIYTNEASWKLMRAKNAETRKREDA
jgi:DNA polymerase